MTEWQSVEDNLPNRCISTVFLWKPSSNKLLWRQSLGFYTTGWDIGSSFDRQEITGLKMNYDEKTDCYYYPEGWYQDAWDKYPRKIENKYIHYWMYLPGKPK